MKVIRSGTVIYTPGYEGSSGVFYLGGCWEFDDEGETGDVRIRVRAVLEYIAQDVGCPAEQEAQPTIEVERAALDAIQAARGRAGS